jgi:aspartyl-tRNA(Asn)/glutamyl-tRNA(Gln) amidotransferase subunit B
MKSKKGQEVAKVGEMVKKPKEKKVGDADWKKTFPIKIGLEIHGYLDTREKLFCKCSAGFDKGEVANTKVCPICTGQPGSKPMLPNKEAMKKLIQTSLILGCKINHDKNLIWQRKHYSWPDLPKGYQNTISGAYSIPCAENGKFFGIRIRECHLEEDPAKWDPQTGKVDYNRSGLPLIEIVTEPDFSSSEQVQEWIKNLVLTLSYIKVMRRSSGIKVDTNVSTYDDRVEMKNINSVENIGRAIEYEVKRQLENFEKGEKQPRETRQFDENKGITIKMREKESAEDYRFIPDPDLPVIKINEKEVRQIENSLPETPEEKLEKLLKKFKLEKADADILLKNLDLIEFFEKLAERVDARKYVSFVTIELLRVLNYNKKTLEDADVDIKPEHLAELIEEVDKNNITMLKAKQIMNDFVPKSFSVKSKLADSQKITDKKEIEKLAKEVIKKFPKVANDFKAGKKEVINFLIGEVMKLSDRRADFKVTREVFAWLLK